MGLEPVVVFGRPLLRTACMGPAFDREPAQLYATHAAILDATPALQQVRPRGGRRCHATGDESSEKPARIEEP